MNNIDLVLATLETLYEHQSEGRIKDLLRGMMLLLEQEKNDKRFGQITDERSNRGAGLNA